MRVFLDRRHTRGIACRRDRDGPEAGVEVEYAVARLGRKHAERGAVEDEHLLIVGLDERVAADSKRHVPELEGHRIVQQHRFWQQLRHAMRELVARPLGFATAKAEPPQQAMAGRLDCQQQVLQTFQLELVRRLREGGQRALDAPVVDEAAVDRQHRMRAHAVKAESPSAGRRESLELAADAISPGIVHSEHRGVRGETQPGPRPCLFHHLPLQLQLMRVGGMLQLAAATLAEVGTRSGHAMRRRLDHARGVGHRHAALPATRLGFHHLAR